MDRTSTLLKVITRQILYTLIAVPLFIGAASAADDVPKTGDPLTDDPAAYAAGDGEFETYLEKNPRRERNYRYTDSNRAGKLTQFEAGPEAYYFRYAEPNFMKEKGYMYGAFAEYTYRTNWNYHVRSLEDAFTDGNKINMFRFEGRFAAGEVDYESEGTGTIDNIDDLNFEVRLVAGYDLPFNADSTTRLTPIFGVAYRYLNDDTGGRLSTTGAAGYERESNYFYLPAGLEFHTECPQGWFLELAAEYDIFVGGKQKSHFEDVSSGYNTIENDQHDGFGARGSIKLGKRTEKIDFFVEPFFRYWNIDDSDISGITFNGTLVGAGVEPENNTHEYGVKLGIQI